MNAIQQPLFFDLLPSMATKKSDRVILFPFMAQGHLIPCAALAQMLSRWTQFTITIINTPLNIQNLRKALPTNTTIELIELPFNGSDHGIPPHIENTDALPIHRFHPFLQATVELESSFELLLIDISRTDGRPALCLIADVFLGWTVDVAKRLGMFHAVFLPAGAFGMAAFYSLWFHLPHQHTVSDEFGLPDFPETFRLHRSQLDFVERNAHEKDPLYVTVRRQLSLSLGSGGILCNTVKEMEMAGMGLLRKISRLPVWAVGPLLPLSLFESSSNGKFSNGRAGKEPTISSDRCVAWLNLQCPSSVIYVSFGSQNSISALQMMELAVGLEASGKPFIWVLRPPFGHDIGGGFRSEWLPEGFEERMMHRKQGLIIHKWAPQLEILSHPSTGAFLSHCGWNSVLESLSQGVPMIGWPLASDQFINSKMMVEEMGVCVEVVRGMEENVVGQKEGRVIGLVMGGTEKGEEMKKKAMAVREMMKAAVKDHGSSVNTLKDFFRNIDERKKPVFHENGTDSPRI
ncbi:UDP-glycosyltransferase 92A1-like [Magnolia sinica]|uniref:UDP-glycosyltransferase 92A1-like n=1 Tax=Magnolia sinica TaxID=86752 RepID=UPI002658F49E|nr:UDP-glycosyltransferase 92A1-like [Magnolia sinica]